jgi:pimeloyl-ACP methyl ester carboxylesterase
VCPAAPEHGRIYCADGAGSGPVVARAFRNAVAEAGLPLRVEEVPWSKGEGRVVADQIDYARVRAFGRCLAESIVAYRRANPDGEVFLVGHSAGSGVVLAALECLPPLTVDRAFLLAPSVSADYDLRPALRASRQGIDVYYSRRDRIVLGVLTRVIGNTDRRGGATSGHVGFRLAVATCEDQALYANLRQHQWTREVAWTGNRGRHFDTYKPEFLRAYILPLMAGR